MEGVNSSDAVFADTADLTDCNAVKKIYYIDDMDVRDKNKQNEIFAFLNKLTFKLSEESKKEFFSELEATLENCSEEKMEDNAALYKFFTKYAV